VALRIQTEWQHNFTNNAKHIYDVFHRGRAEENFDVVDLYDYLFLGDDSGQAVIQLLKSALQLIEPPNPIYAHSVQRVRQ
jgi:hypothetical protein